MAIARRWAAFLLATLLSLTAESAQAERRVALVIGNGAYAHTTTLRNPVNDAEAMGEALAQLGFEVIVGRDLGHAELKETLERFVARLARSDTALFYYAGHGLQVDGENWVIPVDAEIGNELDLDLGAVPLRAILNQMEQTAGVRLIFLDACRDNPMAVRLAQGMGTRSSAVGRGLAPIDASVGTFIAYSTQPGAVAADGRGAHSPFTEALLELIATPGLEIRQLLTQVRRRVVDATRQRQVPWDHSSLIGDFYFVAPGGAIAAAPSDPPQQVAALSPGAGGARYEDGVSLFQAARYQEALATFNAVIAAEPSAAALIMRGNTYVALRDCTSALRDFELALGYELTTDEEYEASFGRGRCLALLERWEEALPALDTAIRLRPSAAEPVLARGLVLSVLNEHRRAIADFDRALALNTEEPSRAYASRGVAYCELGDAKRAKADLRKALELDPSNGFARDALSRGCD
jgi:uncharacterized caspase-like protein